jgi:hypothetical protein
MMVSLQHSVHFVLRQQFSIVSIIREKEIDVFKNGRYLPAGACAPEKLFS